MSMLGRNPPTLETTSSISMSRSSFQQQHQTHQTQEHPNQRASFVLQSIESLISLNCSKIKENRKFELKSLCVNLLKSGISEGNLSETHLKKLILKKLERNMLDSVKNIPQAQQGQQAGSATHASKAIGLFEKYFSLIMANPSNLLSSPLKCCTFIYLLSINNETTGNPASLLGAAFSTARLIPSSSLKKNATDIEPAPQIFKEAEGVSKMARLASVFNSYYIPNHIVNAGFTLVSETDLLRDLLFVFQGIDGAFIQFAKNESWDSTALPGNNTGSYLLRSDVKIPKPTRELVQQLCLVGWVFRMINHELDARKMDKDGNVGFSSEGLYGQALVACVEKELLEYKRLVCVLEAQLDSHTNNSGTFVAQDLSLKRLFVWTRGPLFKMSVLLAILQLTQGKRGGDVLSAIHSYATHGDAALQEYTSQLLATISLPFYTHLTEFLSTGTLSDPYNEFFCSINPEVLLDLPSTLPQSLTSATLKGPSSSSYWKSKTTFHKDLVPAFMSVETAKKCFQVGKSVEFLASALSTPPPLSLTPILSPLSSPASSSMAAHMATVGACVEKAYKTISPFLVDRFMYTQKVQSTFYVLCDFLLLAKGDFTLYLMEQLEGTLDKSAQTIYRHDLVGVLESAIRDCNTPYDSSLLDRLDVCLLESQSEMDASEKGWDVFTLDYRISDPLDTVFSPSSMRIYQKVFSFLWRVKRVGYRLLKGYKTNPPSHSAHLLLHKMIHFTSILIQHLFQTLSTLQQDFEGSLEKVQDLDEVVSQHVLFLRSVCDQVLFASHKSATVFHQILALLESIGEMEALMRPLPTTTSSLYLASRFSERGEAVDVEELSRVFDGKVKEFLKVLVDAGYVDVASKLDFNEVF